MATGKGNKKGKKSAKTSSSASARSMNAKMKGLPPTKKAEEGIRGIVRIAGRDIPGMMTVDRSLLYIKGLGHTMRKAVSKIIKEQLKIDPKRLVGELTEEEAEKISQMLFKLDDKLLPEFLINRRKDLAEGTNVQVIMNDLVFALRNDIEVKKKSRAWHGYRHMKGQKVRGQRTKNTGRGGTTVGVIRKKK